MTDPHSSARDDQRLRAWMDSLPTNEERAEAVHILDMDGGTHATAYLAVGQMRTKEEMARTAETLSRMDAGQAELVTRMLALEKRSVWKDGLKGLGALLAMAAAAVAGNHGVKMP